MSHLQMLLLLSLDNVGHMSNQQYNVVYSGNVSSERELLVLIILRGEYLFCMPCPS